VSSIWGYDAGERTYNDAAMIKKLSAVGNEETLLEIKMDGEALIIRPTSEASQLERVLAAADQIMDAHAETFRKLAK
jgi:hypothetical protein